MRASLHIPGPLDETTLTAALAGLTAFNAAWLATHPSAPSLYESGVRYERERRGAEDWQTLPDLLASKRGDCEDLSSARAAELQVSGEDPDAEAFATHVRPGLWHIRVRRGDGTIEDPSRVLGMGKGARMAGDELKEFKGGWRVYRVGDQWKFEFDLPWGMTATGKGKNETDAMRSAAALAAQALQNPAMQMILPPQATAAIKAASVIAKSPEARAAWKVAKKTGSLVKAAKKLKFW